MHKEIFDRRRRRAIRARALDHQDALPWLFKQIADELVDRLDFVNRPFDTALIIGDRQGYLQSKLGLRCAKIVSVDLAPSNHTQLCADEDMLCLRDNAFDLILIAGGLDSVNDLPGALLLLRRALRVGGHLGGAMLGAGSLINLREQTIGWSSTHNFPAAGRIHPQIDLRVLGDLLMRAKIALPVVDSELVSRDYFSSYALVRDLRSFGLTNCLSDRPSLPREMAASLFSVEAKETGLTEVFNILFYSGWKDTAD